VLVYKRITIILRESTAFHAKLVFYRLLLIHYPFIAHHMLVYELICFRAHLEKNVQMIF